LGEEREAWGKGIWENKGQAARKAGGCARGVFPSGKIKNIFLFDF